MVIRRDPDRCSDRRYRADSRSALEPNEVELNITVKGKTMPAWVIAGFVVIFTVYVVVLGLWNYDRSSETEERER